MIKKARPEEAVDPLKKKHVEFTARWCDEYFLKFGRKYVHQGPRDGSPLKAFIASATDVDVDEWARVATATWGCRDKWLRENVVTIAMLASQWGKCVVQAPSKRNEDQEAW